MGNRKALMEGSCHVETGQVAVTPGASGFIENTWV